MAGQQCLLWASPVSYNKQTLSTKVAKPARQLHHQFVRLRNETQCDRWKHEWPNRWSDSAAVGRRVPSKAVPRHPVTGFMGELRLTSEFCRIKEESRGDIEARGTWRLQGIARTGISVSARFKSMLSAQASSRHVPTDDSSSPANCRSSEFDRAGALRLWPPLESWMTLMGWPPSSMHFGPARLLVPRSAPKWRGGAADSRLREVIISPERAVLCCHPGRR
ncbi:hypothetical protein K458DRAFT_489976 [Lentithecium fluviatile CBS 122367]|uniref:Uncharacterized protein n=1 Tax=Lentithecium fluviatile CBS 122367 TaxID=1168545 RepID=A0A6G1IQB3_9PLEO|nr:hypothetical protein K458DRAFT_489976 [Lentithecium fluviatile CBS 122367]